MLHQRRSSVESWAASRGLILTVDNRRLVVHRLRTAGLLRKLGAVAGLFLPIMLAAGVGGAVPGGLLWAVVGYMAGAICAEVVLGRPLGGPERQASLLPRELDDYLPRFLRLTLRTAGVASFVLAGLVVAVDFDRSEAVGMTHLSGVAALTLGVTALLAAVLIERIQRWILSRPQPVVASDLLEADDAVRSQSVITIAGAALALLLLILAVLFWNLGISDVQVLRWVAWVPAVACGVAAFVSWLRFGSLPWAVQRPFQAPAIREAV